MFFVDSFFDIPIIRPTETQTVMQLTMWLATQLYI
jgi:hypothetical protein